MGVVQVIWEKLMVDGCMCVVLHPVTKLAKCCWPPPLQRYRSYRIALTSKAQHFRHENTIRCMEYETNAEERGTKSVLSVGFFFFLDWATISIGLCATAAGPLRWWCCSTLALASAFRFAQTRRRERPVGRASLKSNAIFVGWMVAIVL